MKPIKFFIVILLFAATAGATDYHPSFLSMGGANSYNGERIADSSALWYATHYDLILPVGGDAASWHIADTLKACNGNLKLGYYSNLHMLGNRPGAAYSSWEYRAFTRHTDSAGEDIEASFFHWGDSLLIQSLDVERTLKLDELRADGNDSATRVALRGFNNTSTDSGSGGTGYYPGGNGDWLCNYSNGYSLRRAQTFSFIYRHLDSIAAVAIDTSVKFVFVDNWVPSYTTFAKNYCLTGINYATRKVRYTKDKGDTDWDSLTTDVDFVEQALIETNQFTFLLQDMYDLTKEVQDTLVDVSGSNSGIIPNVTSISLESAYKMAHDCKPAGFIHENRGAVIIEYPYSTGFHAVVLLSDTIYAGDPTAMQLWEYRVWPAVSDTTTTDADRLFLVAFSSFLCFQHPTVSYFKFGKIDRGYWFSGHGIPLGSPVSAYDSLNYNGKWIFVRPYDSGVVIFRPAMYDTSDTSASGALQVNLDSLGITGHVLYRWGAHYGGVYAPIDTIGPGDNFAIKAKEGALFLYAPGAETPPTISNILPLSSIQNVPSNVTADVADDFGVNLVHLYLWPPDSIPGVNDSVSLIDSAIAPVDVSVALVDSYSWPKPGSYRIVVVAADDSANVSRDSVLISSSANVACKKALRVKK